MDVNSLLPHDAAANQNAVAIQLEKKWEKTGLLEGMDNEVERKGMAVLLENQAKQLVSEASATGTGGSAANTITMIYGKTGIGTTSPNTNLEVLSTTEQARFSYDASNYLGVSVNSGGDSQLEAKTGHLTLKTDTAAHNIRADSKGDFRVDLGDTAGTYAMRVRASDSAQLMYVKSDGNVGIGTETPARKFEVNVGANSGYMRFVGQNRSLLIGQDSVGAAIYQEANAKMYFATNNATRMTIAADGDVGIGTGSPASKLDVQGGIQASSITAAGGVYGITALSSTSTFVGNLQLANANELQFGSSTANIQAGADAVMDFKAEAYTFTSGSTSLGIRGGDHGLVPLHHHVARCRT